MNGALRASNTRRAVVAASVVVVAASVVVVAAAVVVVAGKE